MYLRNSNFEHRFVETLGLKKSLTWALQDGEISKVRERPSIPRDNGLLPDNKVGVAS